MQLEGEELIQSPKTEVWDALNDPEILKECISGCSKIEKTNSTEFKVTMVAAVGPVKAKFNGKLNLNNLDPPNSYTISFNGSGGVAGFGKGEATVKLIDNEDGTLLNYSANATVGGKLAQVGARLIDGVAKKMASDFFITFNKKISKKVPLDTEKENVDANLKSTSTPRWLLLALTTSALVLLYMVIV